MGTPEFMAPEQARDASRADERSDIYSLGATLYALLAGRPPFVEANSLDVMLAHVQREPEPVFRHRAEVAEELSAVVAGMLAKDPTQRYQTGEEVARVLTPFCRKDPAPGRQAPKGDASPDLVPRGAGRPPAPGQERLEQTAVEEHQRLPQSPARPTPWLLLAGGAVVTALLLVGLVSFLFFGRGPAGIDRQSGASDVGRKEVSERPNFVNSVGMTMVQLPGGVFTMGSPAGEKERSDTEEQHEVAISPFYIGRTEVTQKQFRQVMDYNPSYFSNNATGRAGVNYGSTTPGGGKEMVKGEDTEEFPVENVSWEEANEFCEKLTKLDKQKPREWVYRLAREAEWEYACRGGVRIYQTFHFGNSISATQANFDGNYPYGDASKGNYLKRTSKVGSYQEKAPHPFGLCDMHGNVLEWCADWYDRGYYKTSPRADPPGPPGGSNRVYRGGGWRNVGRDCRSAFRYWYGPTYRLSFLGFRAVLVPVERK
jgi:formylglycine-generating enzyme required for sulfatase activity